MSDPSIKHSYVTLPATLNREIRHLAVERDMTINDIIVIALRQYLDGLKGESSGIVTLEGEV